MEGARTTAADLGSAPFEKRGGKAPLVHLPPILARGKETKEGAGGHVGHAPKKSVRFREGHGEDPVPQAGPKRRLLHAGTPENLDQTLKIRDFLSGERVEERLPLLQKVAQIMRVPGVILVPGPVQRPSGTTGEQLGDAQNNW